MRSTRTAAAAAALLTLTLLAGCGGGDDDKKSSDTVTKTVAPSSSAPTTEATSASPTETASETPMDPTGDVTQEQLQAALLTPEEVGAGWVAGDYNDSSDPPLCDPEGTPLDEQVPPQIQGGTEIDHSDGIAAMQEQIAIYASDEEAAQAFAAGSAGLDCTDGSSDGTPVTIGAPQDVTANVDTTGLGTSTAWEINSDAFQGVLVITLAHRVILASSFAAAPDTDTSALPNPIDIQATAFAKALAN